MPHPFSRLVPPGQPLGRCGLGLIVFGLALAGRLALAPALPPNGLPFLTFFPAVVLATLLGGVGPGLMVSALSAAAAKYFFIPEFNSFHFGDAAGAIALGVFVLVALVIVVVIHVMSTSPHELREERARVAELSAQRGAMTAALEARLEELRAAAAEKDQARAEQAASEARLRDLLASLDLGAFMARDLDGSIRFWSAGCERLYGWSAAEAVGQNAHELLQTEFPVPPAEIEAALAQDGEWMGDLRQQRRDGAEVIAAAHKVLRRDPMGRPDSVLEILTEVTEQRRAEDALKTSEARFRAAVQAVSGIVWTNNAAGEMQGEQPGWVALTGQTEEEYQGYGWTRAVHPEDAGPTVEAWHQAVAERRPFLFEHRVRRHDGAWRRFATRAIPVLREDGAVHEWVGVHTDITEQREAEAVLARSREELERMVEERTRELRESEARLAQAAKLEALGRLAGGIAHDFNNVLQAVQGGIGLALRRLPDNASVARRYLDLAAEAASRGAAVTGRLLAFARRGELSPGPVEPGPLLEGLSQLLRPTLGPAVTLRLQVAPEAPALFADAGQLEAVLVNLANNARDALPEGRGTIILGAEPARVAAGGPSAPGLSAGDYIRLWVADDGEGMAPEVLARVTEPFFTTKPVGKGTGLGLAMARGFVEQSRGALAIESQPGKGTTVSLWLPLAPARPAAAGAEQRAEAAAAPAGPSEAAALLLVDDERMVRNVLAASLADRGHALAEAEDATVALARLDAGVPADVLISDFAMPDMDGLALAREARRRRPGLPVVLLAGHVGEAEEAALRELAATGPSAILCKPVSVEMVEAEVAALLRGAVRDGSGSSCLVGMV